VQILNNSLGVRTQFPALLKLAAAVNIVGIYLRVSCVQEAAQSARDKASQAASATQEKGGQLLGAARDGTSQAASATREASSQAVETVQRKGHEAGEAVKSKTQVRAGGCRKRRSWHRRWAYVYM